MQAGTPLLAPQGYRTLSKDVTYYLVRNCRRTRKVLLLVYPDVEATKIVTLHIDRDTFEDGLLGKHIQQKPNPCHLPPALESLAHLDLATLDDLRPKAKYTLLSRVEGRLMLIAPLLEREAEILESANPETLINKHANEVNTNKQRLNYLFFTYITFGRNMWSLLPTFFRIGAWDRLDKPEGDKFGRPSLHLGKKGGGRLGEADINLIVQSFRRVAKKHPGQTLEEIYTNCMTQDWQARSVKTPSGRQLISVTGNIVPTYDQFVYHLYKHVDVADVHTALYGEVRSRRAKAEQHGVFSSSASDLYEVTEADGYHCEDRPKGYVDGAQLPPICVVRCVDRASGLRLGIGFSFGGEKREAYNAMLFCCAIKKSKFGQIIGVDIEEDEWSSIGLPRRFITDRGPGALISVEDEALNMPIREITPSGMGQSKAIVESSQRRTTNLEGPQTRSTSELTPTEMARREVHRLLVENISSDASSRMTPEMKRQAVDPTPVGVWNFLDQRGRNDAKLISFDDAVRCFLRRIEVRVDNQGVWLHSQRYDSDSLRATGLLRSLGTLTKRLVGYTYPFSVRYLWIEIDKRLIEVQAKLPINDDPDQLSRTLVELGEEESNLRIRDSKRKVTKRSERIGRRGDFEDETGKSWSSTRTQSISSRKSVSAQPDSHDFKNVQAGERSD